LIDFPLALRIVSTMIIDAYEERDVAIADIPGAYLHAEMHKGKCFIEVRG